MFQDEFNKIEITNDKQTSKKEFGKTQKTEFSRQEEGYIPEGELNEKYVGKTIKKVTEVNVEYTNKVSNHAMTVVKGATTATTVAATASSVAVAASVVAVTAVAVATGISIAMHDYHYKFNSLFVSANEITYDITLMDLNDSGKDSNYDYLSYQDEATPRYLSDGEEEIDNAPFVLSVSNENYESKRGLFYGQNVGGFYGLTLGDTYSIVLAESRFGGEVLFSESFVTHDNAKMRDFFIGEYVDFSEKKIGIQVDFVDELNAYSDFEIKFTDAEDSTYTYTFPIEKTITYQYLDVSNASNGFDFNRTYNYEFSYKNNGDVTLFKSDTITFINTSQSVSEIYGVTWDQTANFMTGETKITLDYIDQLNRFSNFRLVLTLDDSTATVDSYVYALDKTTEEQVINLNDSEVTFDMHNSYTYMFLYDDTEEDLEQIADSGIAALSDNSGFNKFIFTQTADFKNRSFTVFISYENKDGHTFSDFKLLLFENTPEDAFEIPLDKNNETIEVLADEYDLNIRGSYNYQLECLYDGVRKVIDTGYFTFTDNSGATVEFNELVFDKTADFVNRTFSLQLDYVDELDDLYLFEFVLKDLDTNESLELTLDKTTDVQTFKVDEITGADSTDGSAIYRLDIAQHDMAYSFSYYNYDEQVIVADNVEFRFSNNSFTGIQSTYDFAMNDDGAYLLPIKFLYDPEIYEHADFNVGFYQGDVEVASLFFDEGLDLSTWQYGNLNFDSDSGLTMEDFLTSTATMRISAWITLYDSEASGFNLVLYEEEEPVFSLGQTSDLYAAYIRYEYTQYYDSIMISPIFSGDPSLYQCMIYFEAESGHEYSYSLMLEGIGMDSYITVNAPAEGVLDEETFIEDFTEHPMRIYIVYRQRIEDSDTYTEYKTLVLYEQFKFELSV